MALSIQDSSKLVEALRSSGGMPASNMGGDVFVKAAQQVGLPDDVATLNKIVDLVNQGKSPTEAASIVAGKAQGVANAVR